jgi:hypothetical protein
MKSFLIVLSITLGLTSSLSAQEHSSRPPKLPPGPSTPSNAPNVNNGGWTMFRSDEGRFSVLMPGVPEDPEVKTTPSEHGPYTTHMIILKNPPNIFLVGWVDYDPSFNFNRQAEIEMNRDNFVKGLNATLLTSRHLTIDGYAALEFTAEVGDRFFTSRVYMVGRRPYQIVVGSQKGVDISTTVSRFFNSFKVSRN